MSLVEEASRSVQGAWRLFRLDPAAPAAFNATVEGFWRSFAGAFLLLPLNLALQHIVGPIPGTEEVAAFTLWSVIVLIYVIGWTLWPLLAFHITRLMGCGDRFLGYVVAYNWSQLITGPFQIGVTLFAFLAFDIDVALIVGEIALAGVLFYEYRITRQMLALSPGRAALLVFGSLVVNRVIFAFAIVALQAVGAEAAG